MLLCLFSLKPFLALPPNHPALLLGLPLAIRGCVLELGMVEQIRFGKPKRGMQKRICLNWEVVLCIISLQDVLDEIDG